MSHELYVNRNLANDKNFWKGGIKMYFKWLLSVFPGLHSKAMFEQRLLWVYWKKRTWSPQDANLSKGSVQTKSKLIFLKSISSFYLLFLQCIHTTSCQKTKKFWISDFHCALKIGILLIQCLLSCWSVWSCLRFKPHRGSAITLEGLCTYQVGGDNWT